MNKYRVNFYIKDNCHFSIEVNANNEEIALLEAKLVLKNEYHHESEWIKFKNCKITIEGIQWLLN